MTKSNRMPAMAGFIVGASGLAVWAALSRRRGRGSTPRHEELIRCSATVLAPMAEVYRFWRDPRERARFGAQAEPQFLEEKAPYLLTWRPTRRRSPFQVLCSLRLEPAPAAGSAVGLEAAAAVEATEIRLQTRIVLPSGTVPRMLAAKLVHRAGAHVARHQMNHLLRMKQLAETGEIATTAGQSSGRRSLVVRTLQPLDRPAAAVQRLRGVG